jgi:hypothetical protein
MTGLKALDQTTAHRERQRIVERDGDDACWYHSQHCDDCVGGWKACQALARSQRDVRYEMVSFEWRKDYDNSMEAEIKQTY